MHSSWNDADGVSQNPTIPEPCEIIRYFDVSAMDVAAYSSYKAEFRCAGDALRQHSKPQNLLNLSLNF
jgi:hypothetical protein